MKKLIGFSLLALVLFSACKRPKQIPIVDNPIWPMEIGNKWIFADTLFSLIDSVPFDTSVYIFEIEVTDRGYIDEPLGDRRRLQAWKIATTVGDSCQYSNMIHVDGEGAYNAGWITATNQLQLFEADPVVQYPLSPGAVFTPDGLFWYECPGNPHEEYSPIGSNDVILLNDNATYSTVLGVLTGYEFTDQFWAPGIGPVAFHYSEEFKDTQTEFLYTYIRKRELIGYDLID